MEDMKQEVLKQSVNAVPAASASILTMLIGITLNQWVAIISIIYCSTQLAYLIWKWRKEARAK